MKRLKEEIYRGLPILAAGMLLGHGSLTLRFCLGFVAIGVFGFVCMDLERTRARKLLDASLAMRDYLDYQLDMGAVKLETKTWERFKKEVAAYDWELRK